MQITYIDHSGFLVETAACYYLFDYYQGALPQLDPHKPVLVFASHGHGDHYNPEIFAMLRAGGMQQITAILGKDIPAKKYPEQGNDLTCVRAACYQTYQLPCDTRVYTLLSTDEGVAFVVTCPEGVIYHGGDLNDWAWDGEPEQDNRQMTGSYRHEIDLLEKYQKEQLANRPIDVAFIPLDPRQEQYYAGGMLYFLKKIGVSGVYPMHFWGQPEIIDQFLAEYPEYAELIEKNFISQEEAV